MNFEAVDLFQSALGVTPQLIALAAGESADLIRDLQCDLVEDRFKSSAHIVVRGTVRGVPFIEEIGLSSLGSSLLPHKEILKRFRDDLSALTAKIGLKVIKADYRRKHEQVPGLSYIPTSSSFMSFTA